MLLRRHLDEGIPLTQLAADSGIPIRTIRHWMSRYRNEGTVASLERQPRSDRGKRTTPQELIDAVEGLALRRPTPTAAFIHRRITGIALARGIPAPSYSTVRALVAGIDPGLRTLAQKGDTAYRDAFELVYRRTAGRPNEQWQADHTLLDIEVANPKGGTARPWLTVVLDDYSRAVAGYTAFIGAPNADQTALALHQAIRGKANPSWPVMGLPDVLYSDHGSDFTSTRLERVCLDTHIQLIHSRPCVPQGRGKIERFYRTVTTELLPHLPGYIPHGTQGHLGEINSAAPPSPPDQPAFLATREHRRFTEFANTVRTNRYIGLCWGPAGVGKTLSARHYAAVDEWDAWQAALTEQVEPVPARILEARTAFYTPTIAATVRQIDQGLPSACQRVSYAVDYAEQGVIDPFVHTDSRSSGLTELLIIDEADRLKATRPRTSAGLLRPSSHGSHSHRYARHRKTAGPLPAAL